MSQLSIDQSRCSAESVFGLNWSALPESGDPVLQNSSRQSDQRDEQSTLVTGTSVLDAVVTYLPESSVLELSGYHWY